MSFCSCSYASEIGWDTNRIPLNWIESNRIEIERNGRVASKVRMMAVSTISHRCWWRQWQRGQNQSLGASWVRAARSYRIRCHANPSSRKSWTKTRHTPSLRWLPKLRFRGGNEREPSSLFVSCLTKTPCDQIFCDRGCGRNKSSLFRWGTFLWKKIVWYRSCNRYWEFQNKIADTTNRIIRRFLDWWKQRVSSLCSDVSCVKNAISIICSFVRWFIRLIMNNIEKVCSRCLSILWWMRCVEMIYEQTTYEHVFESAKEMCAGGRAPTITTRRSRIPSFE